MSKDMFRATEEYGTHIMRRMRLYRTQALIWVIAFTVIVVVDADTWLSQVLAGLQTVVCLIVIGAAMADRGRRQSYVRAMEAFKAWTNT